MTPTETAAILRQFMDWRRDKSNWPPSPMLIEKAIDAAIAMIDRLDAAEKERDALRVKVAEMERQEPTHWSCNVLQADASWKEEVGREIPPDGYYSIRDIKPLYALPGAKGEEK